MAESMNCPKCGTYNAVHARCEQCGTKMCLACYTKGEDQRCSSCGGYFTVKAAQQ